MALLGLLSNWLGENNTIRLFDCSFVHALQKIKFPIYKKYKGFCTKYYYGLTLLLKEGISKVLENDLPLVKDGITPEGKTFH